MRIDDDFAARLEEALYRLADIAEDNETAALLEEFQIKRGVV